MEDLANETKALLGDDPIHAADLYKRIIKARSDNAEDFVRDIFSSHYNDLAVGDVDVNMFLLNHRLNTIVIEANKTPDIVFLNRPMLYIGDVAVVNRVDRVAINKSIKYDSVRDEIKRTNPGLTVSELSFIFQSNLSNLDDMINEIRTQFGNIVSKRAVDVFKANNTVLNDMATHIKKTVRNKEEFLKQMSKGYDNNNSLNDFFGGDKPTDKPISNVSDKEIFEKIIGMISDNDKLMQNSLNMEQIDELYDDLKEKNDEMDDRSSVVPIPMLFNIDGDEDKKDLNLLEDYINDLAFVETEIKSFLPTFERLGKMKVMKDKFLEVKRNHETENENRVRFLKKIKEEYNTLTPYACPVRELNRGEKMSNKNYNQVVKIIKERKTRQYKEEKREYNKPSSIRSDRWSSEVDKCEKLITYLSSQTSAMNNMSTNLSFEPDKAMSSTLSVYNSKIDEEIRPIFNRINRSRGVILSSIIRKFADDTCHLNNKITNCIYYSIPIQGSGLFLIHINTGLGNSNSHIDFQSITRFKLNTPGDLESMNDDEKDYIKSQSSLILDTCKTENYYYIITKMRNLSIDKLSKLLNVDFELRTYLMSSGLMLNPIKEEISELEKVRFNYLDKLSGIACLLSLDLHQNPSKIMDLMKYLVSMPSSTKNNMRHFLLDKLNIMFKTQFDVFLVNRLFEYIKINTKLAEKFALSRVVTRDKKIDTDQLKLSGRFSSFIDLTMIHTDVKFHLTEAQLMNQIRPKKLYESQFLDKSCEKVCRYNKLYEQELIDYPDWCTGKWSDKPFPKDSLYCFSEDLIIKAQELEDVSNLDDIDGFKQRISTSLNDFAIYNLSMRGACKSEEDIEKIDKEINEKIHSVLNRQELKKEVVKYKLSYGKSETALLSGLKHMDNDIRQGNDDKCRVINIARENMGRKYLFNMSEKEQRGDGRPIASPNFIAKQSILVLEKPFDILAKNQKQNLLIKNVNRNSKIAETNSNVLNTKINRGFKYQYQLVLDQSQFSEQDNLNKYKPMINSALGIPNYLKSTMCDIIDNLNNRTHFFKFLPDQVTNNYKEYVVSKSGVKGIVGWPQGMLNKMATYFHLIITKYLIYIFNKYYNEKYGRESSELYIDFLINSDDSYMSLTCDDEQKIFDFVDFYNLGKRMCVLKQNEKKSYLTKWLGEMIQRYVLLYSVIVVWAKVAIPIYNNMLGIDLPKDVLSAIGSIQNVLSEGGPLTICRYLYKEIISKLSRLYNIGDKKLNDLSVIGIDIGKLPCELGGLPKYINIYQIATLGSSAQLRYCRQYYKDNPNSNEACVTRTAITLNKYSKDTGSKSLDVFDFENGDKGEVIEGEVITEDDEAVGRGKLDKVDKATKDKLIAKLRKKITSKQGTSIGNWNDEIMLEDIDLINEIDSLNQKRTRMLIDTLKIQNLLDDVDEAELRRIGNADYDADQEVIDIINYGSIKHEVVLKSSDTNEIDGNFAKSLLNCFFYTLPIKTRASDTVKYMKTFKYEGPGLGGLFNIRNDIQQAVGDKRDTLNEMILELSESGFSSDYRRRALANSSIASQKSVMIRSVNARKFTIFGAYLALLKIHTNLVNKKMMISDDLLNKVLTDPSLKDVMIDQVENKLVLTGVRPIGNQVVNEVPSNISDIELVNPLQSVIIDMVKPGFLDTQNYTWKNKLRLPNDKSIIMRLFKEWFESNSKDEKSKIAAGRAVYWHFLSVRRSRYMVAPHLDGSSLLTFYRDVMLKCISSSFQYVGHLHNMNFSSDSITTIDEKNAINNLLGMLELLQYAERNMGLEYSQTASLSYINFKGIEYKLTEFVENEHFSNLYKLSDDRNKRWLAVLHFLITDQKDFLVKFSSDESYQIEWIKEQKYYVNQQNNRNVYFGDFEVSISKGRHTAVVIGEPGNITKVIGNTLDGKVISNLLWFLIKKIPFEGYSKMSNPERWGDSPFWDSSNKSTEYRINYKPGFLTDITKKSSKMAISEAMNYGKLVDYIPYDYNPKIRPVKEKISRFELFSYDNNSSVLNGLRTIPRYKIEERLTKLNSRLKTMDMSLLHPFGNDDEINRSKSSIKDEIASIEEILKSNSKNLVMGTFPLFKVKRYYYTSDFSYLRFHEDFRIDHNISAKYLKETGMIKDVIRENYLSISPESALQALIDNLDFETIIDNSVSKLSYHCLKNNPQYPNLEALNVNFVQKKNTFEVVEIDIEPTLQIMDEELTLEDLDEAMNGDDITIEKGNYKSVTLTGILLERINDFATNKDKMMCIISITDSDMFNYYLSDLTSVWISTKKSRFEDETDEEFNELITNNIASVSIGFRSLIKTNFKKLLKKNRRETEINSRSILKMILKSGLLIDDNILGVNLPEPNLFSVIIDNLRNINNNDFSKVNNKILKSLLKDEISMSSIFSLSSWLGKFTEKSLTRNSMNKILKSKFDGQQLIEYLQEDRSIEELFDLSVQRSAKKDKSNLNNSDSSSTKSSSNSSFISDFKDMGDNLEDYLSDSDSS